MKKAKAIDAGKTDASQPVLTEKALLDAREGKVPTAETEEQRNQRSLDCNQAIREALTKYKCIVRVPTLDISSGRVIPNIIVEAN
jgi:hypothetical protein